MPIRRFTDEFIPRIRETFAEPQKPAGKDKPKTQTGSPRESDSGWQQFAGMFRGAVDRVHQYAQPAEAQLPMGPHAIATGIRPEIAQAAKQGQAQQRAVQAQEREVAAREQAMQMQAQAEERRAKSEERRMELMEQQHEHAVDMDFRREGRAEESHDLAMEHGSLESQIKAFAVATLPQQFEMLQQQIEKGQLGISLTEKELEYFDENQRLQAFQILNAAALAQEQLNVSRMNAQTSRENMLISRRSGALNEAVKMIDLATKVGGAATGSSLDKDIRETIVLEQMARELGMSREQMYSVGTDPTRVGTDNKNIMRNMEQYVQKVLSTDLGEFRAQVASLTEEVQTVGRSEIQDSLLQNAANTLSSLGIDFDPAQMPHPAEAPTPSEQAADFSRTVEAQIRAGAGPSGYYRVPKGFDYTRSIEKLGGRTIYTETPYNRFNSVTPDGGVDNEGMGNIMDSLERSPNIPIFRIVDDKIAGKWYMSSDGKPRLSTNPNVLRLEMRAILEGVDNVLPTDMGAYKEQARQRKQEQEDRQERMRGYVDILPTSQHQYPFRSPAM